MPQSNIEVFYTIWFAVPSEEAQNHGVLCLHGLAGNLGQWSQQCAGRSQHTDERPKDPMMLAEIYVNFASDLWTRPSTSEEMLRVGQKWSIHLPVNIGGSFGRLQVFVIPGDTPFLLGRPVLKHFKSQIDYALDQISIDGNAWTSAIEERSTWLIFTILVMIGANLGILTWWLMTPSPTSPMTLMPTPSTLMTTLQPLNFHLQNSPSTLRTIPSTTTFKTMLINLHNNFTSILMKIPMLSSSLWPTSF